MSPLVVEDAMMFPFSSVTSILALVICVNPLQSFPEIVPLRMCVDIEASTCTPNVTED